MPLDLDKASERSGLHYDVVRRWEGDHEVVLARIRRADSPQQEPSLYLMCECDEDLDQDNVRRSDPNACLVKENVRAQCLREAQERHGERWRKAGHEDAIVDVYQRVDQGEYLGQHYPDMIYVQEVALLLGISSQDARMACDALEKKERLDLNGMILIPYVTRFRFPKELQQVMRMMIEEPLGWPNGDAGGCFIESLEAAIHEHTDYKHGRDAFWPHNYPNMAAHHLLHFGLWWVHNAISRAEKGGEDCADLAWEHLGKRLEDLASLTQRLRQLHEAKAPEAAWVALVVESLERIAEALRKRADIGPVSPQVLQPVLSRIEGHAWQLRAMHNGSFSPIPENLETACGRLRSPGAKGKIGRRTLRAAARLIATEAAALASHSKR